MGREKISGVQPGLVGRAAELGIGRRLVDELRRGRGRTVVLEGEPGVGKSRLATCWAELAAAGGAEVITGGCTEVERERPFGVFSRALGLHLDQVDGAGDGGTSRFQIAEAIAENIDDRTLAVPLMLVVEDIHWADPATVIALHRLIPRCSLTGLLLVLTARPVPYSEELVGVLKAVEGADGQRLSLAPLHAESVSELVAALVEAQPGASLLERVSAAAGNPLYITELVSALTRDGLILTAGGVAEAAGSTTPMSLQLVIVTHLGFLSDETLDVLRMAAVLGTAFAAADLAAVLDRPASSLVAPLREARTAGIVVAQGDRLAFRHDLVREAIYHDHPESLRKALHLQAADRLARAAAAVDTVSTHYRLGASIGDERAIDWIQRAAVNARRHDPVVAAELLGHVLDLLPAGDERRAALLAEQAHLRLWSGRVELAATAAQAAVQAAPSTEAEWKARIVLAESLSLLGRSAEALEQRPILATLPELTELERAALEELFAYVLLRTGDLGGALAGARAGIAIGEERGVPALIAYGNTIVALASTFRGEIPTAIEAGQASWHAAAQLGQPAGLRGRHHSDGEAGAAREGIHLLPRGWIGAIGELAVALVEADRMAEATEALNAWHAISTRGPIYDVPTTQYIKGGRAFLTGEWDDGVAEIEAGLQSSYEVGSSHNRATGALFAAVIAAHRGQSDQVRSMLEAVDRCESNGDLQAWEWWLVRWCRGVVSYLDGELDRAAQLLREAWSLMTSVNAVGQYRFVGGDVVRVLLAVGDRPFAKSAVEPLQEAADRSGGVPSARGMALRCRGLVDAEADASLAAVEEYRDSPRRFERAAATEDAAHVLGAARTEQAVGLLRDALTEYDNLGAVIDSRRVESALRSLGVRVGHGRARVRATVGWESLTPTEHEVIRLVREGLTNRRIGERLFLSTRTIDTHVAHIFRKVGVRSRAELAARSADAPNQKTGK